MICNESVISLLNYAAVVRRFMFCSLTSNPAFLSRSPMILLITLCVVFLLSGSTSSFLTLLSAASWFILIAFIRLPEFQISTTSLFFFSAYWSSYWERAESLASRLCRLFSFSAMMVFSFGFFEKKRDRTAPPSQVIGWFCLRCLSFRTNSLERLKR